MALRKLIDNIVANRRKNKVVNYVEIAGENYVVNGNNRLQAAKKLGITAELIFEKVSLPIRGFNAFAELWERRW
jgi:hypothetical protein